MKVETLPLHVGPGGAVLALPDCGENQVTITLLLPGGNKATIGYDAFRGILDITPLEPQDGSDTNTPGQPDFKTKICNVTNWVDHFVNGKYESSMHPAPSAGGGHAGQHQRRASQILIQIGPNHDF